uniref:Pao retrotransposon peptidase n=1 Tax=Panagrolaimus superbus TaxID=310955 RepID=A0A914Y8F3_9BILA
MNNQQFHKQQKLCVKWELIADRLFISLPKPLPTKHSYTTKREVVQQIARVFDPLGLLAPAILPAKIFAQKLWKDGYEWDERLSKADETTWSNILTEWNSECSFSRRIPSICEGTYELHCFVDASGAAYAAVAYLVNQQHPTNPAAILFSKNRLCPIKAQTIPST